MLFFLQKLRLDKLLVQHQQEEAMIDEDEEERQQSRSEKISTDEIRKLMLHGRTAIVVRTRTLRVAQRLSRGMPESAGEAGNRLSR